VLKGLKAEAEPFVLYAPQSGSTWAPVGGAIQHQDVGVIDKDTSDEIRRIEEHIAQLEEEIELDGR
jgi:hypothetical protein